MARGLPAPPREVPVRSSPDDLAPKFRLALDRVLTRMRGEGHDPIVYETFRTDARQEFLYGFGRLYDDGRGVVTHSRTAEDTYHGYGLAADIISKSKHWGAGEGFWESLGRACRAEGLLWGDDWDNDGVRVGPDPDESFSDRPHVQFPKRRSPSPLAKKLRAEGRQAEVWVLAGAI